MKVIRLLLLVCVVLSSSACASTFFIPSTRMMIPEGAGQTWDGSIHLGVQGATMVVVAQDMGWSTVNTEPDLAKNSALVWGGEMGLIKRLDVYLNNTVGGPSVLGVKYQFLGNPRTTSQKGNVSLALAVGAAFGGVKTDVSTTSFTSHTEAHSKISMSGWETLALVGFRPSDNALLYGGPLISQIKSKVSLTQTTDNVLDFTANPDGEGQMMGFTAGARFGRRVYLNLEATYNHVSWKRTNPTVLEAEDLSDVALGAALGVLW